DSLFRAQLSRWALLCVVLLTVGSVCADDSKISPDLLPLLSNPSNNVDVIIQYNKPQCSGGLLGGILCTAFDVLGGTLKFAFSLINAASATLTGSDVIKLSNQSNVNYISLDRSVGAALDYSAAAVNAPFAWNAGLDGTGVGIAIIDSGIYPHPDLNASASSLSRVVYRKSFI